MFTIPRRIIFFATALLVSLSGFCTAGPTSNVTPTPLDVKNGIWVWADQSAEEHAIFLSRQSGSTWGKVEKLTNNDVVNVVPAVTKTADGKIFVVWSAFRDGEAQLRYKISNGSQWSEEQILYTGLTSNTAPAVCVDDSGTIWIAWAGFNGVNDEIYFTNNKNGEFSTATAITDNEIPDILPVLGIDDTTGTPWLEWQQFAPAGYVSYEAAWNGSQWSPPVLVSTEDDSADLTVNKGHADLLNRTARQNDGMSGPNEVEIEIPDFVTSLDSASLHVPGYAVQSLPVRNMKVVE